MTRTGLITINCTQCGAGIDLHGGGRVRLHVCNYCGAALDAQDDYKLLAQYRGLPRPETPFALGQTGDVLGVKFTVIGTIGWQERHNHKTWTWVDHQIYSPTHGYAWLTWEDGWVVFTRKMRGTVVPNWLSPATIENAESRPHVMLNGEVFTYFSSGTKQPTFIEGEFNYLPNLDMRPRYVSLLGHQHMLQMQRSDNEIEYELSELAPREKTLLAFGAVPGRWPKKRRVHALSPFILSDTAKFLRNTLIGGVAAALVITALLATLGTRLAREDILIGEELKQIPFAVTNTRGLVEFELGSDVHNGWIELEGEVLDANQNVVSEFADGTEYYTGRDSEGRWSEGSRRVRVRTHLPEGQYRLALSVDENVGDSNWSGRPATLLNVTIHQGVAHLYWMAALGVAFLIGSLLFVARHGLHVTQRYATSDWSDD